MPLLHDSCGLERDVLVQLAGLTEPRGAKIVEALDEAYPSGVNQSHIYQILQLLERNGLADTRDVDGRSKASRRSAVTVVPSSGVRSNTRMRSTWSLSMGDGD